MGDNDVDSILDELAQLPEIPATGRAGDILVGGEPDPAYGKHLWPEAEDSTSTRPAA